MRKLVDHLQVDANGSRLWERVLSADERELLGGDYSQAYRQRLPHWGTIGIWMQVRDLSKVEAVLDLAERLLQVNPTDLDWLRSEYAAYTDARPSRVPTWDKEGNRLHFDGDVVRQVSPQADNVRLLLDAFQEEGWPPRIFDPLPASQSGRRLGATVSSLNKGLRRIRFLRDGSGEAVSWERVLGS